MPARWPVFPPSRVVGNASSRAADGAGLQLQMAKRTGRSRCAVPSGSAGSSRAHSSTTSQRAPRSLTPVPTNRARIVQTERRARELGSEARLPHIEPYILFVIIDERLSEVRAQLLRHHTRPHLPALCLPCSPSHPLAHDSHARPLRARSAPYEDPTTRTVLAVCSARRGSSKLDDTAPASASTSTPPPGGDVSARRPC